MISLSRIVLIFTGFFFLNLAHAEAMKSVTVPFKNVELSTNSGVTFSYDLTATATIKNIIMICVMENADRATIDWPHNHANNPVALAGHDQVTLNDGKVIFINGETDVDTDGPAMIRHADLKGTINIHTTGVGSAWNGGYEIYDNGIPQPHHITRVSCHYKYSFNG
jgi:hypothetical protein